MFKILIFAAVCFIVGSLPARADMACEFGQPSVILEDGDPHMVGSRLLQVWEVQNHPVYWSNTVPDSQGYRQFKAELIELKTETDPVRLLERSPTDNNLIVIRNASDWIKPAACLEMLLIGYQHERLNTFDTPSEFASIVLRSPSKDRLRIYYYTLNQDGIGRTTPVVDSALQAKRDGWEVLIALHSHVFHPGQPELDGILAPSEPDADFHVRFYAESGIREAWITNGIHTVRMPASSFHDFRRPSNGGEVSSQPE